MATITVKNIPKDLYERLKKSAAANRRSINSEIIVCIERAVRSRNIDPDEVLTRARALRKKSESYTLSDDDFTRAKVADRP